MKLYHSQGAEDLSHCLVKKYAQLRIYIEAVQK